MLMPQSSKKLQLISEKGSIFDQNQKYCLDICLKFRDIPKNSTFLDTVFSGPGEPIKNLVVSRKDRYKISRTNPGILSRINCGVSYMTTDSPPVTGVSIMKNLIFGRTFHTIHFWWI